MNTLKEINREDTKLLFENDNWDGPICGLMLWYGEKAWFKWTDDEEIVLTQEQLQEIANENNCTIDELDEDDTFTFPYRIYTVYRLPNDILEAIEHNHKLFQELVGFHSDFNEEGNRTVSSTKQGWNDFFFSPPWWMFWKKDKTKLKKQYELKLNEYEVLGKFKR